MSSSTMKIKANAIIQFPATIFYSGQIPQWSGKKKKKRTEITRKWTLLECFRFSLISMVAKRNTGREIMQRVISPRLLLQNI